MLFNRNIPKRAKEKAMEAFLNERDFELDENEKNIEEQIDKTKKT